MKNFVTQTFLYLIGFGILLALLLGAVWFASVIVFLFIFNS